MLKIILVGNLLIWLLLVHRQFSQPKASEFHPSGYYLLIHGITFTGIPIFGFLLGYNFANKFSQLGISEGEMTFGVIASLTIAALLRLAQERNYNIKQDHWGLIAFTVISMLFVFVSAIAIPFGLTYLQSTIKKDAIR